MKPFKLLLPLIIFAIFCQKANATMIHVPGDSSTIQGAVNGAVSGDTILVAPGLYNENVACTCKAILLGSNYLFDHDTLTIASTIIDGGDENAFYFWGGNCFPEDESLTVIGFTIRNSFIGVWKELPDWYGEPLSKSRICHCKFIDNYYGVSTLTWDRCIVDHNLFANNRFGLECYGWVTKYDEKVAPGSCSTIVENNIFLFNNEAGLGAGAGACPTLKNNIFSRNAWGIIVGYHSGLRATDNVVWNNTVGFHCEFGDEDSWAIIENNIIASNDTGICIWGSAGLRQIRYNDVKSFRVNFLGCPAGVGDTTWGTNFNGTPCDSFYNITKDPLFADTIDFELLCNSPCIDAGDSSAPVPESGGYRIDIGKNEFPYIIGDANNDYRIDVTDVVLVINYLFIHGPAPCPYYSGDTNSDQIIDASDIVCWINYLFCGSTFPCF